MPAGKVQTINTCRRTKEELIWAENQHRNPMIPRNTNASWKRRAKPRLMKARRRPIKRSKKLRNERRKQNSPDAEKSQNQIGIQMIAYVAIRLLLWVLGVVIGLFPIMQSHHSFFSFGVLSDLNRVGDFRDGYFIILPTAMLSVTTAMEFLVIHVNENTPSPIYFCCVSALLVNSVGVIAGLTGVYLPEHQPLSGEIFSAFSQLFWLSLLVSLATEIGIAWLTATQRFGGNRAVP